MRLPTGGREFLYILGDQLLDRCFLGCNGVSILIIYLYIIANLSYPSPRLFIGSTSKDLAVVQATTPALNVVSSPSKESMPFLL